MKKSRLYLWHYLFLVFVLNMGCAKKYFPLCPKLANTNPSSFNLNVGESLFNACKEHNIKIIVLSSNVAEFQGTKRQLRWLQKNYRLLLCDFDQINTEYGAEEYTRCMSNALNWIKIIQDMKPEDLMKDGTIYCPVCIPNQICY